MKYLDRVFLPENLNYTEFVHKYLFTNDHKNNYNNIVTHLSDQRVIEFYFTHNVLFFYYFSINHICQFECHGTSDGAIGSRIPFHLICRTRSLHAEFNRQYNTAFLTSESYYPTPWGAIYARGPSAQRISNEASSSRGVATSILPSTDFIFLVIYLNIHPSALLELQHLKGYKYKLPSGIVSV